LVFSILKDVFREIKNQLNNLEKHQNHFTREKVSLLYFGDHVLH